MTNQLWQKFEGDYVKDFYDVLLPSGDIVEHCWPNAGCLCSTDGTGRIWNVDDNVEYRLSANQDYCG